MAFSYASRHPSRFALESSRVQMGCTPQASPRATRMRPGVLISVHIPKCAGTSFRHVLQGLYGDRLWLNYGQIFTRAQAHQEAMPSGMACIHGHFFADAFDDHIADRTLITWVRHPVERLVSNYHHFLRSPDWRDDCCRELHTRQLTLCQFAELDWMRNEATRYLAGKPLADFAFVGVAERFSESLHVFGETCGWPTNLPAPRENVNPARVQPSYDLNPAEYERILALNEADNDLYLEAHQRLDELMVGRRATVMAKCSRSNDHFFERSKTRSA